MGRFLARIGDSRRAYVVFVGKPEGRRPLERHRLMKDYNIKMDFKKWD
jgi:hypothetical protein